jgi:hypothetical protein
MFRHQQTAVGMLKQCHPQETVGRHELCNCTQEVYEPEQQFRHCCGVTALPRTLEPWTVPEYPREDCGQTNDRSGLNKNITSLRFVQNSHERFEFAGATQPPGSITQVGHVTGGWLKVSPHNFLNKADSSLQRHRRISISAQQTPDKSLLVALSPCSVRQRTELNFQLHLIQQQEEEGLVAMLGYQ